MGFFRSLISTSGGIVYHARALFFERTLWRSHQQSVKTFLNAWNPPTVSLVLVGPSAGYSLPLDFLKRFNNITAIEPDPMARLLFEMRTGLRPHWIKDPFDFESKELQFPQGAILFCNLLGQIESTGNLEQKLKGRPWASYHDAYSTSNGHFEIAFKSASAQITDAELKTAYVPSSSQHIINDHNTLRLFSKSETPLSFYYWNWQLTPRRSHMIEGVYSASAQE